MNKKNEQVDSRNTSDNLSIRGLRKDVICHVRVSSPNQNNPTMYVALLKKMIDYFIGNYLLHKSVLCIQKIIIYFFLPFKPISINLPT